MCVNSYPIAIYKLELSLIIISFDCFMILGCVFFTLQHVSIECFFRETKINT